MNKKDNHSEIVAKVEELSSLVKRNNFIYIINLYKYLLNQEQFKSNQFLVKDFIYRIEHFTISILNKLFRFLVYFICFFFALLSFVKHFFNIIIFEGVYYIVTINFIFLFFVLPYLIISQPKKDLFFKKLIRKFPFLVLLSFKYWLR